MLFIIKDWHLHGLEKVFLCCENMNFENIVWTNEVIYDVSLYEEFSIEMNKLTILPPITYYLQNQQEKLIQALYWISKNVKMLDHLVLSLNFCDVLFKCKNGINIFKDILECFKHTITTITFCDVTQYEMNYNTLFKTTKTQLLGKIDFTPCWQKNCLYVISV